MKLLLDVELKNTDIVEATEAIAKLKNEYAADNFQFEMNCSMLLDGNDKRKLRQEIIRQITGETKPVSKCGLIAASQVLKANFEQLTLF